MAWFKLSILHLTCVCTIPCGQVREITLSHFGSVDALGYGRMGIVRYRLDFKIKLLKFLQRHTVVTSEALGTCERLAQGRYSAMWRSGVEVATCWLQVQLPKPLHYGVTHRVMWAAFNHTVKNSPLRLSDEFEWNPWEISKVMAKKTNGLLFGSSYFKRLWWYRDGCRSVSASTAASGTTVDCGPTSTTTAATEPAVIVRRWWNDCFVNNKLHWRERAVKGQMPARNGAVNLLTSTAEKVLHSLPFYFLSKFVCPFVASCSIASTRKLWTDLKIFFMIARSNWKRSEFQISFGCTYSNVDLSQSLRGEGVRAGVPKNIQDLTLFHFDSISLRLG